MNKTRKTFSNMEKKEDMLFNKFIKCRTRKCSKIFKKYDDENIIFQKEQNKACPQKSAKAYYKCSSNFYDKKGAKLKKLLNERRKCSDKMCYKQTMKLKKHRNQMNKKMFSQILSDKLKNIKTK
jgi:hypothetical protein